MDFIKLGNSFRDSFKDKMPSQNKLPWALYN